MDVINAVPGELVSPESLLTFGGLSLAIMAITNGLQRAFGWEARWLGLVVSMTVVVLTTLLIQQATQPGEWFIAVVNGFVVYSAAAGMSGVGASVHGKRRDGRATALDTSDQGAHWADGGVGAGPGPGGERQGAFFTHWWG